MTGGSGRAAARSALLLLGLLSGTYALLAFIPFTYQNVILFPMVGWIRGFLRFHPLIFLGVAAWNAASDRNRLGRAGHRLFHGALGAASLAMLLRPPLAAVRNDASSLALAAGFLAFPAWAGGLDLREALRRRAWIPGQGGEPRRLCLAALATTLFGAALFPALAHARPGAAPFETAAAVWGWTFWAWALVTLAGAAFWMGLLSLGRFAPAWAEPALPPLAALALGAGWLYGAVFRPLAFQGWEAAGMACLAAGAGILPLFAASAALEPSGDESALDLLLRPLRRCLQGRAWAGPAWILAVAALSALLLRRAAVFDWNFMFQKGIVAASATLVFAGAFAALGPGRPRIAWVWALILGPIVALNLFLAFDEGLQGRKFARHGDPLQAQAGRDASLLLLREALSPAPAGRRVIYPVLQANSNIPKDVRTDPVDIRHVDLLERTPGFKPDIFIIVVDSLRRDYLGAYNPEARRLTPNLDAFAAESYAFRNAFARYGATGLSEPSIWTGALMLHKQYVTPFHAMNSLEKLLEADGYRAWISMDNILDVVVKPQPWIRNLDPGVGTQDLRLGPSLDKLSGALDAPGPGPVFAYTQAQDLHISVLSREGRDVVAPGDYRGFDAAYASRLARLDRAFGAFVARLKQSGRYDRSLIVFAADHGDSLGEEGRFGHAYTLFPEIVRIPLIVHLPPSLAQGAAADLDAPAFLTDLTPSLYYLLGHRPVKNDPMLGRPLLTATLGEQAPYRRDHYLLASSYGAVFGILDGAGADLYIADGVNFADHAFRLDQGGPGGLRRPVAPEQKRKCDQLILDDIAMINRFYHFQPR